MFDRVVTTGREDADSPERPYFSFELQLASDTEGR